MPTYQYACTECGHQLEAVQAFSDAPLSECPTCQGRLRKLFNSVGIVFKGTGFYRTDSRAKVGADGSGNGAEAKAGGKDKAASTNGSSGDSSAKPATESSNGSATSSGSGNGSNGASSAAGGSGGGSGGAKAGTGSGSGGNSGTTK